MRDQPGRHLAEEEGRRPTGRTTGMDSAVVRNEFKESRRRLPFVNAEGSNVPDNTEQSIVSKYQEMKNDLFRINREDYLTIRNQRHNCLETKYKIMADHVQQQ